MSVPPGHVRRARVALLTMRAPPRSGAVSERVREVPDPSSLTSRTPPLAGAAPRPHRHSLIATGGTSRVVHGARDGCGQAGGPTIGGAGTVHVWGHSSFRAWRLPPSETRV